MMIMHVGHDTLLWPKDGIPSPVVSIDEEGGGRYLAWVKREKTDRPFVSHGVERNPSPNA